MKAVHSAANLLSAALVLSSTAAIAQTVPASGKGTGLEEIVVTARRVEESQQTVPIAVTALSADMLERATVNEVFDLPRLVPSLVVAQGGFGGASNPGYTIRGLGNSILADPGVIIYFDEVAVESRFYPYSFYDLASVQIVKGPQGTLFGKNSTGGAVLFVSQRPTDQMEGFAEVGFGNFNERRVTGAINVPISEAVKFRLSGNLEERDGTVESATGGPEYNDRDNWSVRAQLTLNPTDALEIYTAYTHNEVDQHLDPFYVRVVTQPSSCPASFAQLFLPTTPNVCSYYNAQALTIPPVQGGGPYYSPSAELALQNQLGNDRTVQNSRNPFIVDVDAVTNIISWEVGPVTIKNIAHYEDAFAFNGIDSDGTRNTLSELTTEYNYTTKSNELQVIGKAFDRLDWIAGLYYSDIQQDEFYDVFQFTAPTNPRVRSQTSTEQEYISKAVFVQPTLDLSSVVEGLSVTAGYRHTWDEKDYTKVSFLQPAPLQPINACRQQFYSVGGVNSFGLPLFVPGAFYPGVDPATCSLNLKDEWDEDSYNLTVNWQFTSNMMAYVAHRKGYKAGGFNFTARLPQNIDYEPEIAKDYEVGFKGDFNFGSMLLRTNLAVYHTDYESIQTGVILVTGTTAEQVIKNDSLDGKPNKAELEGIEAEITFVPVAGLTLGAFYGRVDKAEYKHSSFLSATGAPVILDGENIAGVIPENYGFNVSYSPLFLSGDWGRPTLSAGYSFRGQPRENAFTAPQTPPQWRVEELETVDAQLRVEDIASMPLDVSLYASNLTDERARTGTLYQPTQASGVEKLQEPRTYGVQLRYRFGAAK
ncbi:MAG: TonB-dependent receptor [Steroidobacteraceae bacterium]